VVQWIHKEITDRIEQVYKVVFTAVDHSIANGVAILLDDLLNFCDPPSPTMLLLHCPPHHPILLDLLLATDVHKYPLNETDRRCYNLW